MMGRERTTTSLCTWEPQKSANESPSSEKRRVSMLYRTKNNRGRGDVPRVFNSQDQRKKIKGVHLGSENEKLTSIPTPANLLNSERPGKTEIPGDA